MCTQTTFKKLIAWSGSQSALARALGYRITTINSWSRRGGIPLRQATRIAALPGCPVTAEEIAREAMMRAGQVRPSNPI